MCRGRIQKEKNRLRSRLRICPRLNFDSMSCLNYLFWDFFQYRKSHADSQAVSRAVFQAVFWPCELNPRGSSRSLQADPRTPLQVGETLRRRVTPAKKRARDKGGCRQRRWWKEERTIKRGGRRSGRMGDHVGRSSGGGDGGG